MNSPAPSAPTNPRVTPSSPLSPMSSGSCAPVTTLTVVDDPARLALLVQAENDLRDAGGVVELVTRPGPPDVIVALEEEEAG